MLLTDDRVYLVDWPHAKIGARWLDLVWFLPSVAMQGEPPPERLFSTHPLSGWGRSLRTARSPGRVRRFHDQRRHRATPARAPQPSPVPTGPRTRGHPLVTPNSTDVNLAVSRRSVIGQTFGVADARGCSGWPYGTVATSGSPRPPSAERPGHDCLLTDWIALPAGSFRYYALILCAKSMYSTSVVPSAHAGLLSRRSACAFWFSAHH